MRKVGPIVVGVLIAALAFGVVQFGWPMAQGAWAARRLAAVVATGADGRQFTVMDVLEQVAAQTVQQAVKEQQAKQPAQEEVKP